MSQYATKSVEDVDFAARWASIAIREQIAEIQRGIPSLPSPKNRTELAPIAAALATPPAGSDGSNKKSRKSVSQKAYEVCIIGAGVAGLFTAMILDYLNVRFQINVKYEILESNGEDRLGGRLFTYYFKNAEGFGDHDYYDVGAMRFPDISTMKRTFDLFEALKMTKKDLASAKKGDLVPYYLSGPNNPQRYNDVGIIAPYDPPVSTDETKQDKCAKCGKACQCSGNAKKGPTAKDFAVTGLLDWFIDQPADKLIGEQIKPFTEKLKEDPRRGWDYLKRFGDKNSVRSWFENLYDYNTTEWLETYTYGTSWYDEALSEMVLEDINFDAKNWYCVNGGSQEIARRMEAEVKQVNGENQKVAYGKRVTKIEDLVFTTGNEPQDGRSVSVTVRGQAPRSYHAVFNSAPLGSMQRMDLRGLNLNWGTKQAIRSLGYGASCKIAIRFKSLWWINKLGISQGGVGKTDLPIRVCVYPSYNLEEADKPGKRGKPGVLLCSYTWSQEAQRIGSLINSKDPEAPKELKDLLIDNLAKLHEGIKPDEWNYEKLHELISSEWQEYHAYDWYSDPGTTGAFAYFGPGQFQNMYPWIVRSDGRHMIIGEAASAHHAWVVGALESAVRGVYQFLANPQHSANPQIQAALQAYNRGEVHTQGTKDREPGIPSPFGPLPAEYDRFTDTAEIKLPEADQSTGTSAGTQTDGVQTTKQVAGEGEWLRQTVLFETIRQQQKQDQLNLAEVKMSQVKPLLDVTTTA